MRHAIAEMAENGPLEFGGLSDSAEDASLFVVCDDPRRIGDLGRTIQRDRVILGTIGAPVPLTIWGKEAKFSVGEWILIAETAGAVSNFEKAELARIVAVDAANATIDVDLSGERKRIDLMRGPAVRSASVLSIREARPVRGSKSGRRND